MPGAIVAPRVPVAKQVQGVISPLVTLCAVTLAFGGTLLAAPAASTGRGPANPSAADLSRRQRVVLRISGRMDAAQRAALVSLLRTELGQSDVEIEVDRSGGDVLTFIRKRRQDDQVLAIVWLDTRVGDRFKLYVVDAARERALVRVLPGGLAEDLATLEAVASIVVSAVGALREGIPVASERVEDVVEANSLHGSELPAGAAGPERSVERKETAVPAQRRGAVHPPPREPKRSRLGLVAGLGPSAATFETSSPLTLGIGAFVGVVISSAVAVRISGARHLPRHIDTTLGRFQVDRSLFGATLGWVTTLGIVEVEPELGLGGETLSRSDAEPTGDASARGDTRLWHLGGKIGVRARYPLSRNVALEPGSALLYFPGRFRFLAGDRTELAAPWPVVGAFDVALVVLLP